jgi:coenzyme F420-reducing hydrogenase delta subunit/Pyruvate/2-oxoacid:ferredoxin oxidoreductase delta subunit
VTESVEQALAAASRAGIPMWNRVYSVEAMSSLIDPARCIGCGICESLCPYGAIQTKDKKAYSVKALCKGCGNCSAGCPTHAITMSHFSDEQIRAQMNSILDERGTEEPKIIAFCCNWCSYAGADLAGVSRFQYPPNTRIIRVMCSARVDPVFVFNALLRGAEGVLITGCHLQDCHYIDSNMDTLRRYRILEAVFQKYGMQDRIRLEWVSASEGERFATITKEFVERIKSLGKMTPEERELLSVLRHVFDGRKLRTAMNMARKNVRRGMDEAAYAEKVKKIALDEIEATRTQIHVHGKKPYPIYVSGNIGDLKKHREAVWKALQEIDVTVAGMDYFGERLDRSFEEAIAELAACRVFFVIIGTRYGKVDEETGKSVVEREYEAAVAHKLEIHCFLPQGEGGGVAPATGKHIQQLEALKARLQADRNCTLYTDAQDLAVKVAAAVLRLTAEGGIAARAPPQQIEVTVDRLRLARGENPVVRGIVHGTMPGTVGILIAGNRWRHADTIPVGSDGRFTYTLPARVALGMPEGEYEVVIQESGEPAGKPPGTRVAFTVQEPVITVDPVADHTVGESFTVTGTTNIGQDRELAVDVIPDTKAKKKFFPSEHLHASARIRRGTDGSNIWSASIEGNALRPQAYELRVVSDLGATAKVRFSIAWR